MQWDAILRDSLRPAGPFVVWLGLALATSILVAIIREPLCRVLREAAQQIGALRARLISRSAISVGRRVQRFWLLRQYEPTRTVAASLDRIADALPHIGQKSLARVASLQADLQRQIGLLQAMGLEAPSLRASLSHDSPATARARGSWGKLLMLLVIAGLTGAANSFLLNEFFQGVITADALFPSTIPDLHVSHVFAVLIFTMEVAIGFALHHFAEAEGDESAARKLLALAPWLVLVGLLWLEGWAYALLSYQIDIPERLNLPATSGLYTFARYFLALFGAGLTLLLASLGYLLGKEVERIQLGSELRRQERFLEPTGWAFHQRTDQIDRTERALARLKSVVGNFQLDLAHQFKRAVDATSGSEELAAAVNDAITQALESSRQVDGAVGRRLGLLQARDLRPIRTRPQALAEMSFFTTALASLVVVSLVSGDYVAGFVRDTQEHPTEALAVMSGVVLTGFGLSAGYLNAVAWRGDRSTRQRILRLVAMLLALIAGAAFVLLAVANQTLGEPLALNFFFGTAHAGVLLLLGAMADAAMVNALHWLQLVGLHLERWIVWLAALALWILRVVLALVEWLVRLVAVFGQLVVRPRPAVRVGVAEAARTVLVPREVRAPARRFADKATPPANRSEHA